MAPPNASPHPGLPMLPRSSPTGASPIFAIDYGGIHQDPRHLDMGSSPRAGGPAPTPVRLLATAT